MEATPREEDQERFGDLARLALAPKRGEHPALHADRREETHIYSNIRREPGGRHDTAGTADRAADGAE